MANVFGRDILIQAAEPAAAADFYTRNLGFEITSTDPILEIRGPHINLFIVEGAPLGPVLEVFVENVTAAKARLVENGCTVVKDEPAEASCYIRDPFGVIYNLAKSPNAPG